MAGKAGARLARSRLSQAAPLARVADIPVNASKEADMKIVILGGSGLIGKKMSPLLQRSGHEVVSASPSSGVDSVTGQGLLQAFAGADVVVDVSNSPSFEDEAVMNFFRASTGNLLAAARAAGVGHVVALSVVGSERSPDSGYLRAKLAQESLIRQGAVPWTIVRATQFFEFLPAIAESCVVGGELRATSARLQPIAADDVALAMAEAAMAPPRNAMREIAGPQALGLDELLRRTLQARGDARKVVTDDEARYFGARLDDATLTPADGAWIGATTLAQWLQAQRA